MLPRGSTKLGVIVALALAREAARADDGAKVSWSKPAVAGPAPTAHEPRESPAERARAEAARFGMVSVVARSAPPAPPRPWLRDDAGPPAPAATFRSIWAQSIDDAAGAPGLRLSSTGDSGGVGAGVSTPEHVRTVGGGANQMDLDDFDHRGRALAGEHVAKSPPPPDRHTPPDVIQRIVRENLGRMQLCYDTGLAAHPRLAGRVAVKFVIDRRGSVALARDAGSDLPDADVVGCVVRAFDALMFPASDDSSVTVVYALAFRPGARTR